MGKRAKRREQALELHAAMLAGEGFAWFVDRGKTPPAFTWVNRFARGHPGTWSDFTLDGIEVEPDVRDLMHRLFAVQNGEAGLLAMIETERAVTLLLGKMAIDATANLLRDHGAVIKAHWEYADPRDRWLPEMHTGQVALANELLTTFSTFELAIYNRANDGDRMALQEPAIVVNLSVQFLAEEIDHLNERVSRLAASS